jgi:hypothetical protein
MLRTTVALLVLCLVAAVAGSAVTGQFWFSLVAMAGTLGFGAAALSLVRIPDEEEVEVGADVRALTRPRRLPTASLHRGGTGGLSRAA